MANVPPSPVETRRARLVLIALGLGTLGAFAAAVVTVAPSDRPGAATAPRRVDPITATLLHCQTLGDGTLADAGCRAARAEHRRRFLARGTRP